MDTVADLFPKLHIQGSRVVLEPISGFSKDLIDSYMKQLRNCVRTPY